MTIYFADRLRVREINSGCETYAYRAWGKPNEVTLMTSAKNKWEYLNFMGLTTSNKAIVYIMMDAYRTVRRYRFNVIRMQEWDYMNDRENYQKVQDEIARFPNDLKHMKPEEFDILRPSIEFCIRHQITWICTDFNMFNFLQHPVTGRIYPYDSIVIPDRLPVR